MINLVFGFIAGLIIFTLIFLIYFYPKYKIKIELDQKKIAENKELEIAIQNQKLIQSNLETLYKSNEQRNKELEEHIKQSIDKLSLLKEQAAVAAEDFKQSHLTKAEAEIKLKEKEMTLDYQNFKDFINKSKEEAKEEYLLTLKDYVNLFVEKANECSISAEEAARRLADLKAKVDAAVAANKRQFEEENKKDFYRLIIPEEDLNEIQKIREIIPYLRNPEPLNKVIYKYYYEKPYNDLVGRILGLKIKTGIYKITNLNNGLCYVGQAVNVADRWRQHIKRGLGAETPTQNKLYPAMLKEGVENFSFELIEECERSKLNDREDYWQDFFKAKEFGYSIK